MYPMKKGLGFRIIGTLYDANYPAGRKILTSKINWIEAGYASTDKGTYRLGKIMVGSILKGASYRDGMFTDDLISQSAKY
ncbi:MAG: hypothetical protein RR365_01120 [Bacteroides sp.]